MKLNRKYKEALVLVVMFLYAVSLFNLAGYIFFALAVVLLGLNLHRIRIAFPEVILFLFAILYFSFQSVCYGLEAKNIIIFLCGPWAAFMMGKLFVEDSAKENAYLTILSVLAAGMLVHGVLNWGTYYWSDSFDSTYSYYRISIDVWRGTRLSVTTNGMFFTFAAGLSLGYLFSDTSKKQKRIAVCVLAICMAITVFYANKTLLYIVILIFSWEVLVWFFSPKVRKNTRIKVLLFAAVLLFAVLILLATNAGGFRDWFLSLKLVKRLQEEDNSSRIMEWSNFFKDYAFLRHPFGGSKISGFYLHNLWLDAYNVAGIFPFFMLILFTLWVFGRMHDFGRVARRHGRGKEYIITRCMLVAFFLNAMVEPVLDANPYFFLTALMILGAMEGRLRNTLKKGDAAVRKNLCD